MWPVMPVAYRTTALKHNSMRAPRIYYAVKVPLPTVYATALRPFRVRCPPLAWAARTHRRPTTSGPKSLSSCIGIALGRPSHTRRTRRCLSAGYGPAAHPRQKALSRASRPCVFSKRAEMALWPKRGSSPSLESRVSALPYTKVVFVRYGLNFEVASG